MRSLDAIHFCYRNFRATQFTVEQFKKHFPESKVALIVDKGGLDFTEYSNSAGLYVVDNNDYNLGGTGSNAYLESHRAISLANRIKRALEQLDAENVLILEDDVYVKQRFEVSPNIIPAGQITSSNLFPEHISKKWFGYDTNWGMCGGSIMNRQFFLSIYEDIIEWTKNHHDSLKQEFNAIGAGDCFMSFHFARHGKRTSLAPWLKDGAVVHPYKNLYPPGWTSENHVEW